MEKFLINSLHGLDISMANRKNRILFIITEIIYSFQYLFFYEIGGLQIIVFKFSYIYEMIKR